jgi:hypothetical protein
MMSETAVAEHRRPPVGAVVALLTVMLSVLLIAFAWPASRSEPRDLPVGAAGPAAVTNQVAVGMERNAPGAFEVHQYADRAAAVAAIEDREVYGAIVPGRSGIEVLTASAGSPVVAQALTQFAGRLGQQTGTAPTVTDVVPLPEDDPRGAGLAAGALPLVLGGILAAVLLTRLVPSGSRRIAGALAFAVAGGLALTAVLQFWLGALDGNYWANSGVVALAIAATSITILGLEWLLGPAGLALGAAIMMLLGNPLSGMASAPEMLPSGWGALGQLLPPGAAGTMLRSVAFFDGAAIAKPVIVLTSWLVAGLLLCVLGAARARSKRSELAAVRPIGASTAA